MRFEKIFTPEIANFENLTILESDISKRSLFDYIIIVTIEFSDFCYFVEKTSSKEIFETYFYEISKITKINC